MIQATGHQGAWLCFNLIFSSQREFLFFNAYTVFWQKLDSYSPSVFSFKSWSHTKKCVFMDASPVITQTRFPSVCKLKSLQQQQRHGDNCFQNPQSPNIILPLALAKEFTRLCSRLVPRTKLFTIHGKLKKKKKKQCFVINHILPGCYLLNFCYFSFLLPCITACFVCATM